MTLYEFVARPSTYDRRLVCEWLERHGIDPSEVPEDGWIETQEAARRVAFQVFVFEDDPERPGQRRLKSDGRGGPQRDARFVQLESPPMPFPIDVTCVNLS